ncbi:hypothetical protein ACFYU9_24650 [Streptomyces sp. NPDC004327]|uniref:hypothetical protein n=1 Tax=unclassified Streptomyces TaxID=2593676 RepID=UPI0036CDE7ED
MKYQVSDGVRIQPISVPGRFFVFSVNPHSILQIDAKSALVIKLAASTQNADEAVAAYASATKSELSDARANFERIGEQLIGAGILTKSL